MNHAKECNHSYLTKNITHCLKIDQKVSFEFSFLAFPMNFLYYQNRPVWYHCLTTKSSLARNVIKWDFFCEFQTLWNIRTQSMKITPQSLIWQQLRNSDLKLKCKKCWGLAIGTSNLLDAFEVKWKTRTSFKAYLEQKDIKNESFISSTYIYVHYVFVCHLVSTNSSHYYWTKKFSNGKHIQGSATHTGAKFEFCPLIKKNCSFCPNFEVWNLKRILASTFIKVEILDKTWICIPVCNGKSVWGERQTIVFRG